MAAKRISSTAINWQAFSEVLSKENMPKYLALKSKNDAFIRRVGEYPEELPKIDWKRYKSIIYTPGIVDSFQKAYEALKIPYPSDQGLISKIDEQEKDMKAQVESFTEANERETEELESKLSNFEATKKYSEMSMEEIIIARPEVLDGMIFKEEKDH